MLRISRNCVNVMMIRNTFVTVLARRRKSRRRKHNSSIRGCKLQSEINFETFWESRETCCTLYSETDNLKSILLKAALLKYDVEKGSKMLCEHIHK